MSQATQGNKHHHHHAHHFKSAEHEFEASKFGIWIFLCTEILMFGGLFVGYIAYSGLYPEIFEVGSQFLDWKLGALNTIVLLFSSFTIALSIRNLQRNEKKKAFINLLITFLCGLAFMGIKGIEYNHKFHLGLYPGKYFNYQPHHKPHYNKEGHATHENADETTHKNAHETTHENAHETPAAADKTAADKTAADKTAVDKEGHGKRKPNADMSHVSEWPENLPMYFSFYFIMTGIHGSHVLIGMGLILWCMIRLKRGDFSSEHYTFVEGSALFWHLVDLVWIYLFPLLYLI